MHIHLKKEQRNQKIERALKNNLKKRKIFQNKIKEKLRKTNERFIRPMD
tara:strand:+ start:5653 stop:5799 length:147 start_codon:yes stop_codon:yes gene_type:complete